MNKYPIGWKRGSKRPSLGVETGPKSAQDPMAKGPKGGNNGPGIPGESWRTPPSGDPIPI